MTTPSSTEEGLSPAEPLGSAGVTKALELYEIKPGVRIGVGTLKTILPDAGTAAFFAKLYKLDYHQLSALIRKLFNDDVVTALIGSGHAHSTELQDYIVDTFPADAREALTDSASLTPPAAPDEGLLAQLVEEATVTIANAIQVVANKIATVMETMPSMYGQMVFTQMRKLNRQTAGIGTFEAHVVHRGTPPRLVIMDVSGSMSEGTVRAIVDEVVGLAYATNSSFAVVSDDTVYWEPGTFDSDSVLDESTFRGTHYESLRSVLNKDWDTVVTIADYDSSISAKSSLAQHVKGKIGTVYDISLVNRPTYLAECVGQFATKVEPLLIGNSQYVLSSGY